MGKKYIKTDFHNVIFTDETRSTLDGPDGWEIVWLKEGQDTPKKIRRCLGGGGIMIWGGIVNDELIGPVRTKMNFGTQ